MGGLLERLEIELQALRHVLKSGGSLVDAITAACGDPPATFETSLAGVE